MRFSDFYAPKSVTSPKPIPVKPFDLYTRFDDELKAVFLFHALEPNDVANYKNSEAVFVGWPEIYYGRLDAYPGIPGLYHNFKQAIIKQNGQTLEVPTVDLLMPENLINERGSRLPADWYCADSLGIKEQLPDWPVWEADLITLQGSEDIYQVHRIDYRKKQVTIIGQDKERKVVSIDEVKMVEAGPVKQACFGDEPPRFRNTVSSAEFQVLLGRYKIHLSPAFSYAWDQEQALSVINKSLLPIAHGLLLKNNRVYLVSLHDEDLGSELAALTMNDPSTILQV